MPDRIAIARRLATNLPIWAVARGCNMPEEEIGHLMWEASFRELIGAWQGVFEMPADKRTARLEKLAHFILEEALGRQDLRAVIYVDRERRRSHDPVASLAKGFCNIVEHDKAKAARLREELAAEALAETAPPAEPQIDPASAAIDEAKAAAAIRPAAHPVDRSIWAKAAQLRRGMFGEVLLQHAVEERHQQQQRDTPLDLDDPWQAEDRMDEVADPAPIEVAASAAEPAPQPEPERSMQDILAGEAAAEAALCATLAKLPENIRQLLKTFTPDEMDRFLLSLAEGTFPGLQKTAAPQGP